MAGTIKRAIAEWSGSATEPMAMTALLNLLARLEPKDAEEVLRCCWRQEARVDAPTDERATLEIH